MTIENSEGFVFIFFLKWSQSALSDLNVNISFFGCRGWFEHVTIVFTVNTVSVYFSVKSVGFQNLTNVKFIVPILMKEVYFGIAYLRTKFQNRFIDTTTLEKPRCHDSVDELKL